MVRLHKNNEYFFLMFTRKFSNVVVLVANVSYAHFPLMNSRPHSIKQISVLYH